MFKDAYHILLSTTFIAGVIPLLLSFTIRPGREKLKAIYPFVWLLALATVYEIVGTFIFKLNTSYWFQVYTPLEILAIYYYYRKILPGKYGLYFKIALFLLGMVYLVSCFFIWGPESKLSSTLVNQVPLTIFVIIGSFLWFRELFRHMNIENLWKSPHFYFVASFLIYYASTFFLFLFSVVIFKQSGSFREYWIVNIIAALVARVLVSVGLWMVKSN